jgi:phosphate transport system substrate-binding protein
MTHGTSGSRRFGAPRKRRHGRAAALAVTLLAGTAACVPEYPTSPTTTTSTTTTTTTTSTTTTTTPLTPAPITGGGSTLAAVAMTQWRADTAKPPYNLQVSYSGQGSGFGRLNFLNGLLDFGVSDTPLQASDETSYQESKRKSFVYVPTNALGLALAFNLTGSDGTRITSLRTSPRNACRLMTEEGMFWDDSELAAENPGVALPHRSVGRMQRADGNGETVTFSSFCIANAPDVWAAFITRVLSDPTAATEAEPELKVGKPTSRWVTNVPTGTTLANSAEFLAAQTSSTEGSVAIMAAPYATNFRVPMMSLKNAAGVYLQPDPTAVNLGLSHVRAVTTGREAGTFLPDFLANDPGAYPLSVYSYVMAQTDGFDPAKGRTLSTFLRYAVTDGQLKAERLGYVRLPAPIVNLALAQIAKIPGA